MPVTGLSEALQRLMRRAGVGTQTLSKLTGVPRTAIDNWRDGSVGRPRHWQPLLRIARVLSLTAEETDALLVAAGHPTIGVLESHMGADHPERHHLAWWAGAGRATGRPSVRAPTADFVGRAAEVARIHSALRGGGGPVVGIRGMGGIGKTELAVVAANRAAGNFPDGVLLVTLGGVSDTPVSAAGALREVITAFEPDVAPDGDVAALHRRYCAVLGGRRVLVVADDAAEPAQVRPLLPPPGCALLVTSRQRFTLPGMGTVDLDELAAEDAAILLTSICDRLDGEHARQLAALCGHLPLALRIVAGLLHNDPALTAPELLDELADRRGRLSLLRDPDDCQHDVAASLGLSYARLDDEHRAVFRQLAVFAASFDAVLADEVVRPPRGTRVNEALRLLLRRNLVLFEPVTGRWRLHDLVRDLAREYAEEAGDGVPAMWRYAEAGVGLAEAISKRYAAGAGEMLAALTMVDMERPHLDAAWRWAARHAGTPSADRLLVAAAIAAEGYGFLRYHPRREMRPRARTALLAARRLGDEAARVSLLKQLGHLELEIGNVRRAVAAFERQVRLMRAAGDAMGEARALNNLSIAYVQAGQPRRAVELNERQLELVRAAGSWRGEAMALSNLGRAHLFVGEPEVAVGHLEAALVIVRQHDDRFGEFLVLDNLGSAVLEMGDAGRAAELCRTAYEISQEAGDRVRPTDTLCSLGEALLALGRVEEAVDAARRCLSTTEDVGAYRVEARAKMLLGRAYLATGEPDAGRGALEQAMALRSTAGDVAGLAESQWELGRALLDDDRVRALSMLRSAVAYWRRAGHARAERYAAMLAGWEAAPGAPE